jgi:hypothetical protein
MVWGSNPGEEARFSAPVQNGHGVHPASYTMGTGSFPGIKRPGRDVDHPPPSKTEVEGRVEPYLYSPSGLSWPVLSFTTGVQPICDEGPRPLLQAGSLAACGKITKYDIQPPELLCDFYGINVIYKCGHGRRVGDPCLKALELSMWNSVNKRTW